jgi:hypothetical protein
MSVQRRFPLSLLISALARRRFSNANSSCMSAGKLKHKHATELKALEKEQARFCRRSQQAQIGRWRDTLQAKSLVPLTKKVFPPPS